MIIDVGAGMRSADIPDGMQDYPDRGTCPVCRDCTLRLKKDDTLFQHWTRSRPRRRSYPPCPGTGQEPSVLNEYRVKRYLATQPTAQT